MSRLPCRRSRAPRSAGALVAALVLALSGGCGLRLETPPPEPLTPGVDEVARQRASADAAALAALADTDGEPPVTDPAAGAPAPVPPVPVDPLAAARAAVESDAATHVRLLGGVYDDGLDPEPTSPGPGPEDQTPAAEATSAPAPAPAPAPVPPDAVLAELVESAATARTDLATVADGGLARLLASVSASRLLLASRVAAVAGLPAPPVPGVVVPRTLPSGLGAADVAVLVAAEDAAGYALEVVAAKHTGDLRARAGERATEHRARARAWAEAADIAGTGLDPRRVAYALPPDLADPAVAAGLAAQVEQTLAADYGSLVATVDPAARVGMADALTEAAAHAVAWGAPLPALPGMPEHAAG